VVTLQERDLALELLTSTRDRLIQAVSGISEHQWRFKPAIARWSIAEILEHVVLVEEVFHSRVVAALQVGPAATREAGPLDALVLSTVADRATTHQAPERLVPSGRWSEVESRRRFEETRRQTIAFSRDPAGFRERTVNHPFLGPLDGYQWVLMVATHGARHTEQIIEVNRAPAYPLLIGEPAY
jgi:DinB superfamily